MITIGIVGCGTIGSALARAVERLFSGRARVVCLFDAEKEKAAKLAGGFSLPPAVVSSLGELVEKSDLVIEAASAEAAPEVVSLCLVHEKPVMVMSVGGLLAFPELFSRAEEKKVPIYLPSGALAGLDGVKAAAVGKITQVVLTTRKPPQSLKGAPYLIEKKIDLDKIEKETILFEGTAQEAVRGFPKNINVSAALSLAGVGPEKTMVRIVTAPDCRTNSHEIRVEGEFGILLCRTDNLPAPENPKTSYLAILSAIATLKGILSPVKIGT